MKTNGVLIVIGGNEDKGFSADERYSVDFGDGGVLQQIVQYAGGKDARIEVITTASSIPYEVGDGYMKAFERLGCTNVHTMYVKNKKQADDPVVLERIKKADVVMFSGGDQTKLCKAFRKTEALTIMQERYQNNELLVAGTSAGAMVLSAEMIKGGSHGHMLKKGGLKLGKGFGFVKNVIFDTHFIHRRRFGRLAEAVALHPDKLGVGLGEDTALVIHQGEIYEIIGSGMVIFFDGTSLRYNRAQDMKAGTPISLSNLVIHILAARDKYFVSENRIEIFHSEQKQES